jgi:hypothetical protein
MGSEPDDLAGVIDPEAPSNSGGTNGAAQGHDPVSGRFLPGNAAALTLGLGGHGLGAERQLDRVARLELRDAVLSDLGGEGEVSAVMRVLVDDFAQAVVLRDAAYAYLGSVGPLTKAGRQRAVVGLYLQASARAEKLAALIGTSRRAKPLPSLSEIMAESKP